MGNSDENEHFEGAEGGGNSLRIDRWLWCTRLFKSRTLAADAVGGGKVHLNGRRVKPAQAVHVGDKITITRPGFEFECEVLQLPQRRGSAPLAQACYAETEKARALEGLQSAAGFLRSRAARALTTRTVPELHFELDRGLEHAARINELLNTIRQEDPD